MSTAGPVDALSRLVARRAGAPLLTWYGAGSERTELSAASFANWVDKTANLLDDLGLDSDARVALTVLVERPAHWMALVWPLALWQRGMTAWVVRRETAVDADLAVTGPDSPTAVAGDTLACSLHPWGLPLVDLPVGVTDYASEALAQPDVHAVLPADPAALAWSDGVHEVSHAKLSSLEPISDRVALCSVHDPWLVISTLIRVVLGGGSLVLSEGHPEHLPALAAAENARLL